MTSPSLRPALALLISGLVLAGCAAAPDPIKAEPSPKSAIYSPDRPWPADFAGLRQQAQAKPEQLLAIDAAASSVRIHVFRGGRAARLGHNHVLSVPGLQGLVLAPLQPEDDVQGTAFELAFRLDELVLDEAAARAALGPGWASALSAEAIAATRQNMLGAAGLQAEMHPWVRLRSLAIRGAAPKLAVLLEIELHGQRRQQWLAMHTELQTKSLQARGALVLRQSDFGLQPFSIAGGLLAVQDELLIEFELIAKR
ncbi:hypothetical protein [Roseateles sp.]|uniref:hypothetical protein n=1 Tax=Roseateles sp. TaxID=1971397 RepID=UPI003BA4AF42